MTDEGRRNLYARLEQLGEDQVRADMEQTGGIRVVGGPQETRQAAWEWLAMKKREREQAEKHERERAAPSYTVTVYGPQAQVMLGNTHSSQTMTINWQGDIEQRIGSFVASATETLAKMRDASDAESQERVDGIVADLDFIKVQLGKAKKNPIVVVELLKGVITDMAALSAVHVIASAPLLAPVLERGEALLKMIGLA